MRKDRQNQSKCPKLLLLRILREYVCVSLALALWILPVFFSGAFAYKDFLYCFVEMYVPQADFELAISLPLLTEMPDLQVCATTDACSRRLSIETIYGYMCTYVIYEYDT